MKREFGIIAVFLIVLFFREAEAQCQSKDFVLPPNNNAIRLDNYNHFLLSYDKAYSPWTGSEINFVRSVHPHSSKSELFKAKGIFNDKRLALMKDLEFIKNHRLSHPVLRKIHRQLTVFIKRFIDLYTRVATTLGSHRPSNYQVLLNENDRMMAEFKVFGSKYKALCAKYHIERPAISPTHIWGYKDSWGKRK